VVAVRALKWWYHLVTLDIEEIITRVLLNYYYHYYHYG
jgi:hypothetical protein